MIINKVQVMVSWKYPKRVPW